MHLHLHIEGLTGIETRLSAIERKLDLVLGMEATTVADLSVLANEVQNNTDASNGIVVVVNRLADELEAAATDPAQVQALADQLRSNTQQLADAIVANTPADTGGGTPVGEGGASQPGPGTEPGTSATQPEGGGTPEA